MKKLNKIIRFIFRDISFRLNRNEFFVASRKIKSQYKVKKKLFHSLTLSCFLFTLPSYSQDGTPQPGSGEQLEAPVSLEQIEYTEEVQETELNILTKKPTRAQLSRELRVSLDAQFERIQQLIKTEDAYSSKLGEEYLGYGLLLTQAGEIDQARKMVVDALHISKVNDGVYSIEQRPILRALFEINLLKGKSEDLEANLSKIIWIENKNIDHIGTYSFDLALKLGHHYLDLYLIQSVHGDVSLGYLDSAAKHFSYAIRQYGRASMDELLMPYGELSEVHFYRKKLVDKVIGLQRGNSILGDGRNSPFSRKTQFKQPDIIDDTFFKAKKYSELHLIKAQTEKNKRQTTYALLALADTNLLFNRKKTAAHYYKQAWLEAQKLAVDAPIRLSFDKPVKLPAFNHSLNNEDPQRQGATYAYLPVMVDVNPDGKVTKVEKNVFGASSEKIALRARRIIKNTKFRPAILDGEMVPSSGHEEKIRVLVSKK